MLIKKPFPFFIVCINIERFLSVFTAFISNYRCIVKDFNLCLSQKEISSRLICQAHFENHNISCIC